MGILAGTSTRSLCSEVMPQKGEGQPEPREGGNRPALKCRSCLRASSLSKGTAASLLMYHPLLLFLWNPQSGSKEVTDATWAGPSVVHLQGTLPANQRCFFLHCLLLSALTQQWGSWEMRELFLQGRKRFVGPQWSPYLGALQTLMLASNTDFHTEPTNELKTGDPVGFSAVDCKQRTEPHFLVWPARFCLLPEAATLLFKKWTNLWRRWYKMSLANYAFCRRNDQLQFGKCWL